MEIVDERIVSDAEAKAILEKREKEIELGYEQRNALEHLRKYCKLDDKAAKSLWDELASIGKLTPRQIAQIVNILPQDTDDLRVILEKSFTSLSEDEVKKVLDAVKKAL